MTRAEDEAKRIRYIPCAQCKLMDFFVTWNEATAQSAVVCQNCREPFIQIIWAPQELPDPAVII